jgi:Zn-dependent protease
MLTELLRGTFDRYDLVTLLVTIPVVLLSLSFHEFAHGFIASKLGDETARYHGRLTLNPVKHLDPIGALAMLFFGIGWAKPVPVNPRNFDNPKKGMALVGLAGPVSNLILSFIGVLFYRIFFAVLSIEGVLIRVASSEVLYWIVFAFEQFFLYFAYLNAALAVFNLIPVPPFDGSRVFYFVLPDKYYFSVMRYERVIMMVTLVLLFTGALDVPLTFLRGNIVKLFDFIVGLVPFL